MSASQTLPGYVKEIETGYLTVLEHRYLTPNNETINYLLLKMVDSNFLWVGHQEEAKFGNLSIAFPGLKVSVDMPRVYR